MNKQAYHNPLEGERPELTINLHDGSDELVSIIVVHRDRPGWLNLCLQSIALASVNNNYEIIVVDNGSGQESQDYLTEIEQDGIKVIRNAKNLYWSTAANQGAEAASKNSKYLIFMHCDVVILNPAWIDLFVNVSESQQTGMIGLELQTYFMQNSKVDFIQEWCMMLTRECWEECKPFPERLPQVGPSFIMTARAQAAGFKPQAVRNNQIAHHYRIFSIDINEFERLTEQAMTMIPQVLREIQPKQVKK
jgi:GT2 family glycosyltransferase